MDRREATRPQIPEVGVAVEEALNRALKGDLAPLREVFEEPLAIDDALLEAKTFEGLEDEMLSAAKLMENPRISFVKGGVSGRDVTLEWIASGTWGAPWKPRIMASGTAQIRCTEDLQKVESVATQWRKGPLGTLLSQVWPRLWDYRIWFAAPSVERVPFDVLSSTGNLEVRRYPPRTMLKVSFIDTTGDPMVMAARLVPDFAITGELITAGRLADPYWTTGDPEVRIRPLTDAEGARARDENPETDVAAFRMIEWYIHIPSMHGIDAAKLPPLAEVTEDSEAVIFGDAFQQRSVEYVVLDESVVAVQGVSFNHPQDAAVPAARKALVDSVDEAGGFSVRRVAGRPQFGFIPGGVRTGYNEAGELAICVYEPRPAEKSGSVVFLELAEEGG